MQINFDAFKKTFLLFLPYILKDKHSRRRCLVALGIVVVDILAATLVPYFSKQMVEGASFDLQNTLCFTVVFLGFFWTLEKICTHIQEIVFFPVVNSAIQDISYRVIKHIHELPMKEYQALSMSEIISSAKRISPSARSFIKIFFLMIIPTSLKLIVVTFICCKMGSFGFSIVPALALSLFVLYKGFQVYITKRERSWNATDTVIMRMNDSILNTKLARPVLALELQTMQSQLKREASLWVQTNNWLHSIHLVIGLIIGLSITLILFQATTALQNKTLSLGDLVLLKGQLIAAFLPFKNLCLEFRQLAESLVDIKKIRLLLEQRKARDSDSKQDEIPNEKGLNKPSFSWPFPSVKIQIEQVSFYYQPENPLLDNLSLHIHEGEKITFIGKNGCGKSTLLAMIAGLISPKKGHIFINPNQLTSSVSVKTGMFLSDKNQGLHFIPQDFRLFNQSLRDNLLYGRKNVKNSEIFDIIEIVGLNEVIRKAKFGLETPAGEMGSLLSGGENRRLALARALLHKPEILLLDETLDSLNLEDELSLFKQIFAKIPILLIVSHHPLCQTMADKVFSLELGKLRSVYAENTGTKKSANRLGHRKSRENQGLSTYSF